MSASHPESVSPSRDTLRSSTSASAPVSSPSTAASSHTSSLSAFENELVQQIAALQLKIDAAEKRRDELRAKGDPDWKLDHDELKQLRDEKAQLRTKEELLLKKEEQLRDEAKEIRAALRYQSGTFVEHGATAILESKLYA